MAKIELKGIQQIKGFNSDGSAKELALANDVLYFIRTSKDNLNEGYLYFNGKKYGAPSDIDCGEY